jgi:hypothetical protein
MEEQASVRNKILAGDFILFQYAATQWVHHVEHCANLVRPEYFNSLCITIAEFLELRKNKEFVEDTIQPSSRNDFRIFRLRLDVQVSLAHIQSFLKKLENGVLQTDGMAFSQGLSIRI